MFVMGFPDDGWQREEDEMEINMKPKVPSPLIDEKYIIINNDSIFFRRMF